MRILIVSEGLATKAAGSQIARGAGKVLAAGGAEVAFLSLEPWPDFEDKRWSFKVYPAPRSGRFQYVYDPVQAGAAAAAVRDFKPDLAHAVVLGNIGGLSWTVLRAIQALGIPVVFAPVAYLPICMNTYFYRPDAGECYLCQGHKYRWGVRYHCGGRLGSYMQWLAMHLQRDTLRRIKVWLSPNETFDQALGAYGIPAAGILRAYHPFDWDRLADLHTTNGDYFVFYAQGRLEKGIHLFPEILARTPGCHYKLFLAAVIWPHLDRLQASSKVVSMHIGRDWHNGLGAAVAGSRAAVLPTANQGFSDLAVYEGMALGKPVVSFKVGGNPWLIRDQEDGFLLPPGDMEGFARAIELLHHNPRRAEEMGRAAKERAVALFNRESVFDTYRQAYKKAREAGKNVYS
jgi:glycosyltransferase involved in cell wall biosynthesis